MIVFAVLLSHLHTVYLWESLNEMNCSLEQGFMLTDSVISLFVCFSGVGDFSIWEFSGNPVYFCCYDYFAANDPTTIHIVLFSLEEPYEIQLNQVTFWLSFLKSLVPVEEPIGMLFCLLMTYYGKIRLCITATSKSSLLSAVVHLYLLLFKKL